MRTEKTPDNSVLHIGKVPKNKGIFGVIDTISDHADYILDRALSVLTLRYGHEKKIKQALEEIDFDYLELLLKKVVKNSASASGKEYKDFKIADDSVTFDSSLASLGGANAQGYLMVNPARLGKSAKEYSLSDENLNQAVAMVVAHEAIHLLARKDNNETGFTQEKSFISANEAMTELLARAVGNAYSEFTNTTSKDGWLYFTDYQEDINHLLALMAIVARDNQVEIESVIQAFTASYFCDNSVLDSFSEFANISEDAQIVIDKLKVKQGNESTFNIAELSIDEETKSLVETITKDENRNGLVRKALHI